MSGKIVRVWNANVHPYSESFKGQLIKIEAGKFIEMEHFDAVELLGTFHGVKKTADGMPDPRFYKKLRLEVTGKTAAGFGSTAQIFKCHACGMIASNQAELDKHVDDNHTDIIANKEEYDQAKKDKRRGNSI